MAKVITFDGELIGTTEKYRVIDSGKNVQKAVDHYKKLVMSQDEDDLKNKSEKEQQLAEFENMTKMPVLIAEAVADLLSLSGKDKKAVIDLEFSFDDEYKFFSECVRKFLGIELPVMDADADESEETEDPKLPEED
ncbi:hypothetical protein FEZ51_08580 [Pediococcus stilesii]|uniref:Uncharacterized protein n=1 Tax=Pediococcus stilesii TaxID=331679 RepID=A0A5R9BUF8_9LACO|nr:hypothetical protein [Pediococcus stilesii]TLQ03651.1 hypothetical protein FEZ51_08580 [Pediococcus stilesii]